MRHAVFIFERHDRLIRRGLIEHPVDRQFADRDTA